MKELLNKRYSERKYTTEKVVTEHINYILDCMLMSPSGKNKNPWKFILVNDVETIKALAASKKAGAKFLLDTQHVIVVVGDENASDTWIEDASVTMTIGHLAATHLELGSCWIQTRNREAENENSETYVKRLLNVPTDLRVLAILSIGHVAELKTKEKVLDHSKVYMDVYGDQYDG